MNVMPLVMFGMAPVVEGKPDEKNVGGSGAPGSVDILIEYANDGTPSAHPDHALVRRGGMIIWHTHVGVNTPFDILPKIAWVPQGQSLDVLALQSHHNDQENWQEVKINAASVAGTYPYGIRANNITVDPDVVIRP